MKWEKIVELWNQGERDIDTIALKTGSTENSVRVTLSKRMIRIPKPKLPSIPAHWFEVAVTVSENKRLQDEANKRGIGRQALVTHLLQNVIESDLFKAVLDD